MNQQQYNPAGLERLTQAIEEQAEKDFLAALRRNYPGISEHDVMEVVNYWRYLRDKAKARLATEHSRGNEGNGN